MQGIINTRKQTGSTNFVHKSLSVSSFVGKPVSSICKQTPYPSLYIDYGVESSNHNGFLKILTLIKFNYFRIWFLNKSDLCISTYKNNRVNCKENRIYIRVEFRQSLGMNFFSPFQPEREFKVYKSCKCSQIICSRVH